MLSQEEATREYNRQAKQRERKIEKVLIKFYAWQQYPGESFSDFRKRFRSVKILVDLEALPEQERIELLNRLNKPQ